MLFSLKGKVRSGYVLAFILLLISYFLIFHSTFQLNRETDRLTQSQYATNKLARMKIVATESETAVAGYLLTGNLRFLSLYHYSNRRLPVIYDDLRKLTTHNDVTNPRLDTLHRLITLRLSMLADDITMYQRAAKKITPDLGNNWERSRSLMDSIRMYEEKMVDDELNSINEKRSKLASFFSGSKTITLVSLITAILAILYSLATYNKENESKTQSEEKVKEYSRELEENISELKELRGMEKFAATGHIARAIAHEVRNPLTNISLATEQLHEISNQHSDSSMLLDMISRNTVRISQLVTDLLNATKFVQLATSKVNINSVLDQTLEMAKDRIELQHIQVEKYYAATCDITADIDKIKIAFLNIIVNAIEAMEKYKGILRIITSTRGNKCVVEISDNGTGMDEESLQKIFDPFFTSKAKGNGLGLTNTQNIILSHKGNIKVQSRPGQGTLFTIVLNVDLGEENPVETAGVA